MTRTTTYRALAAAAAALAVGLSACAGAGGGGATAGPTTSSTPTRDAAGTPSASAEPSPAPVPATDAPTDGLGGFDAPGTELTDEGDASGYVVTDVRTGVHDGYARVVYELEGGEGTPGYRVGYVDAAVEDPSGEVREVAGNAILRVILIGTTYPVPDGPQELTDSLTPGTGGVAEVTRPLTFEAMSESFVGLDAQRPFRVTVLTDPVRVVVDLAG